MLDYENAQNPYDVRKNSTASWRLFASRNVRFDENNVILENAKKFMQQGLKQKDAIHCACALYAGCDCLLTVDRRFLKADAGNMKVLSPIEFIEMEAGTEEHI